MPDTQPSSTDLLAIAERAYIYAYPLVLVEVTRSGQPVNVFTHVPQFPRPDTRKVIRPNADTLYTIAWIDLSKEPILIHVPDSGGRFYLLQFMDAWTETFADPGKRTTGTAERWFAFVGPGWTRKLPEDVTRYDAPTNIVWLLGRTQTNGPSDYDNVHVFQHSMRIMPLSSYPNGEQKLASALAFGKSGDLTPPEQVKAMTPVEFFTAFARAMKANPPHSEDAAMVADLARIGITPGEDFATSKLTLEQLQAVNDGAHGASARLESFASKSHQNKPGWGTFIRNVGRYGIDYISRGITARLAVGANPPEDAVYMATFTDGTDRSLSGSARYRMHFDKDQIPPVLAFWSLTAYDKDGYFIANPLNRYAIGDRDPLKFIPDGSLDLYIQNASPGNDRESNWLPSGNGPFNLIIRLYWPQKAILDGTWQPPPVELTS
ncbi:MAG TPA: DUF1254 domain-containing protein [Candidatus Acidoferrum sp.]|nr:DUF1254 domain-containing protein [Candidatus Acidoferrum sp.]